MVKKIETLDGKKFMFQQKVSVYMETNKKRLIKLNLLKQGLIDNGFDLVKLAELDS